MRSSVWLPVASTQVWTCVQLSPLGRSVKLAPAPSSAELPSRNSANVPDAPVAGVSVRTQAEPHTTCPALVLSATSW
jgi:hypothetical protein